MVATKEAVTDRLAQACADGLVGIGRGQSLTAFQATYCKQSVSLDPSEDGVWIIPPFIPESAKVPRGEQPVGAAVGASGPSAGGGTGAGAPMSETSGPAIVAKPVTRSVRRFIIRGDVPVESWTELFRCFVQPAIRMNLKKLRLGVQFEMEFRR